MQSKIEWKPEWDEQMLREWLPPYSTAMMEFARRFGVSLKRIRRAAKRLGLDSSP